MRLRPSAPVFYDMFAEAGENLQASADDLARLCEPGVDRVRLAATMVEREHRGDLITHRILREVNTSFVTPFDRDDIYRLAGVLDDAVDAMQEVTDFVVVGRVGLLPRQVHDQVRLVQLSAHETAGAMARLRTLRDLEPYFIEVNRLENEADRVHSDLLSILFSGEYDPLTVMRLREVVERLEDASDALEHVAHAVETIAVKES